MVHGKRSTLMPEDVEYAMEALNVEVSGRGAVDNDAQPPN